MTVGVVTGDPKADHISTSYVERQNLSMRMGIRRFTRLTNAFSKKVQNHFYARHPGKGRWRARTLWSMDDIVKVVEEWKAAQ